MSWMGHHAPSHSQVLQPTPQVTPPAYMPPVMAMPPHQNNHNNVAPPLPPDLLDPRLTAPYGFPPGPSSSNFSHTGMQTMPFLPVSGPGMGDASDPNHFMWALSSQLPMIEETSPPNGPASTISQTSSGRPISRVKDKEEQGDGKVVKISWFRPHGQTAYAPGKP